MGSVAEKLLCINLIGKIAGILTLPRSSWGISAPDHPEEAHCAAPSGPAVGLQFTWLIGKFGQR